MGDTISKTKFFIFLSIICLIFNMIVCCVAYLKNTNDINDYLNRQEDLGISGTIPPNNNVTLVNFALSTGTSFVPFFSIVSVAILGLDTLTLLFVSIILAVIGTLQVFLIVTIILNMLPFFNV